MKMPSRTASSSRSSRCLRSSRSLRSSPFLSASLVPLLLALALSISSTGTTTTHNLFPSSDRNVWTLFFGGLIMAAEAVSINSINPNEINNDDDVTSNDPSNNMDMPGDIPNNLDAPNSLKNGNDFHSPNGFNDPNDPNHPNNNPNRPDPSLNENSIVLITGAAGFLGSELALALRRTYGVRKLLLVDNLGIESENESAYVPPSGNDEKEAANAKHGGAIYTKISEENLSLFEFKRQRAFRIFQELTSPFSVASSHSNIDHDNYGDDASSFDVNNFDDIESIRFYRADLRPSIPEFFDFGEVPLLEGIFQSHPGITHVVHLADVADVVGVGGGNGENGGSGNANAKANGVNGVYGGSQSNQAVPRGKDSIKAGRMEGILEEMRLILERRRVQMEAEGGAGSAAGGVGGGSDFHLPQLVYASSSDVYDYISTAEQSSPKQRSQRNKSNQPNPPPFREDKPITTPSSLRGASKLIDEVLASAYHSTHGIYSVGLRFFPVYGPWATPGTEIFDLVERVLAENDLVESGDKGGSDGNDQFEDLLDYDSFGQFDRDIKDYVFIDDAVDAIMAAMQYRPPGADPPPVVFNVGTGKGVTLREVRERMEAHFPKLKARNARSKEKNKNKNNGGDAAAGGETRLSTTSYADTSRSEVHLGFRAHVSLNEGLAHTIGWHRDRNFPYGRGPTHQESTEGQSLDNLDAAITSSLEKARSEGGCSLLDRECLRSAPIFPCASECHRPERCTPSMWDDVADLSERVTTGCDAVLYTILLDDDAEQIPSATTSVATDSLPYVGAGLAVDAGKKTQVRCNIAFVSERSPLVQRLKSEGEEYSEEEDKNGLNKKNGKDHSAGGLPPLLRHGFWTVLPVKTPSPESNSWLHAFSGTYALEYLPKVSPGRFFGASVRYAAYAEPTILLDNLPKLLKRVDDGPPPKNGIKSATALMLSEKRPACDPSQRGSKCFYTPLGRNGSIQSSAYNMIRVALRGEVLGGGLNPVVDSSFLIHSLHSLGEEDSRLFRCDVYGEIAQWGAESKGSDERAFEFIVSLHDLWSRAVMYWNEQVPWWGGSSGGSSGSGQLGEEGSAGEGGGGNGGSGEEGDGDDDGADGGRRLSESNDSKVKGTWFGILSSTEDQLFTHIVAADAMGIIHLDDYSVNRS